MEGDARSLDPKPYIIGVGNGDTRSLDYSSNQQSLALQSSGLPGRVPRAAGSSRYALRGDLLTGVW